MKESIPEHELDNIQTDEDERTEEVQEIIDRMPTQWAKYVALLTAVLIVIIFTLGFVIKYPDTVDGEISITANQAPLRLVANTSGKIHLLQKNKGHIGKEDVIAYIESGADYKDILKLESLLQQYDIERENTFPMDLILGDLGSIFNSFVIADVQYKRFLNSDIYEKMLRDLEHQIETSTALIKNTRQNLSLKKEIISIEGGRLHKDSILFHSKALSQQEYDKQHSNYLSLKEAELNLENEILQRQAEINKNKLEISRIQWERKENREKYFSELSGKKNELINSINIWKEKYLLYSTIDGELEYLGFWRDNYHVNAGQELFSVIPEKNNIIGEVVIPSFGAGKVEVGQPANVKVNNFPNDEYGFLKGYVQSISRLTNKVESAQGKMEVYLVYINFPDGMVTNFGKELPLDFETKGTAEIITKRKRLIERLFDNLKSKTEK